MRFLVVLVQLSSCVALAEAAHDQHYSTNAICRQNNCLNPLFPGLTDLSMLESSAWQCQSHSKVRKYLQFCEPAVNYDVAVPSPNSSTSLQQLVEAQEKAAVTMYFYHLAGMNMEPQEHKHPESSGSECVKSVWMMVCNTYFPKAEAGCRDGQGSTYLRPCKNVCGAYLQACDVRCCDEGTQCVFDHKVSLAEGGTLQLTGYNDNLGPSAYCTGGTGWDNNSGARRATGTLAPGTLLAGLLALFLPLTRGGSSASEHHGAAEARAKAAGRKSPARGSSLAFAALLALVAVVLQGCDPVGHPAAAWESKPGYLLDFQFVRKITKADAATGKVQPQALLNSCMVPDLPKKDQCSGNGVCKPWNASSTSPVAMYFCECDRDWADPECRTRRKSQAKAYALSLFTGYLGFDRFYLGETYTGMAKLATAGGLGFWWVIDIARIGSSPVYAENYRLAADLPHNIYVIVTVAFFTALGAWVFGVLGTASQKRKLKKKMMLKAEEEFVATGSATSDINAQDRVGMPVRSSWRVAVPAMSYGTMVPPEVKMSSYMNPFSGYSSYTNAERMYSSMHSLGGEMNGANQAAQQTLPPPSARTSAASASAAPAMLPTPTVSGLPNLPVASARS